jgi:serine/threonine protein kinase
MLSDFGIAKILDAEETADLTASGVGIGTPQYMAPEQGFGRADARSDVYSLGTVFYEMVTGRTPYKADTPMAVMLKKSTEPLPRPKRFVPDLPDAVEALLLTALHRDPAHRHQSMSDFRIALENLRDGKLKTPKTSRIAPPVSAWWVFSAVGICIGLAIIAILAMTLSPRLFSSGGFDDAPTSLPPAPSLILPTHTSTQLILPTETLSPTETPFPTPTTGLLPSLQGEVETFIIDYWDLVSNKDFQTAYRYLSADFKARNHPNGVEGFRDGFKYTSSVRVLTANAVSVNSSSAIVDAELRFVTTDGSSFTTSHRYTLIREDGRWVIDSAKKK